MGIQLMWPLVLKCLPLINTRRHSIELNKNVPRFDGCVDVVVIELWVGATIDSATVNKC